jgi:hypothetical protein
LRRVIGICFVIFGLAACGSALAQNPNVMTFLSVNDVQGITSDGTRLWLATEGGSVSYNPATHESRVFHREREGLLSDSVSAVAVAPDGRIWFATQRSGISIYDPDNDQWEPYTSLLGPIPGDKINRIRSAQDSMYVSARQGLSVFVWNEDANAFDRKAFYLEGLYLGLPSADVHDIVRDPHRDGWWIATTAGVVHRDSLAAYSVPYQNSNSVLPVVGRLVRYRGEWVGAFIPATGDLQASEVKVLRFQQGGGYAWEDLAAGGPTSWIHDMLVDSGVLYIATDLGVVKFDGTEFAQVGAEIFSARSLYRAPNGVLYAGAGDEANDNKNGLRWLDGSTWRRTTFPGPTNHAWYRSLLFDSNGVLHTASTAYAIYQTFNGTVWGAPRPLSYWTFDMLPNPGGGIWLGHCCCELPGCPLEILIGSTIHAESGPHNLRDLAYDEGGNLWGASYFETDPLQAEGIWMRSAASGLWTQFGPETSGAQILASRVRSVLPVGREVWIGYADQGVQVWDLGPDRIPMSGDAETWTRYTTAETGTRHMNSNNINRMSARLGKIWVATDNGITIIEEHRTKNITAGFNRLPSPNINVILPLADGGAWVGSSSGLTRMTPAEVNYSYATYSPPDLPHPFVESVALDPDGRSIWAGTARGLARLTPRGSSGSGDLPVAVYPNPFRTGCGDGVRLYNAAGLLSGVVVDLSGKRIARFERKGTGEIVWDGKDADGKLVAPGLYMIRVSTASGTRGIGVGVVDGPCP